MVAGYIIDYVNRRRMRKQSGGTSNSSSSDQNPEVEHNFVLCKTLHPLTKLAFWATNTPYWYLTYTVLNQSIASRLGDDTLLSCLKPLCANSHVHGFCVFVIALASTAFHGAQLELDKDLTKCACVFRGFAGFVIKRKSDNAPDGRVRTRNVTTQSQGAYPPPSISTTTTHTTNPARKRLVKKLLLCDVLCANVYVVFLATCASLLDVVKVSLIPVGCMFVAAQAKRQQQYNKYVLFHSLWHLGSAWAIYKAFGEE